MNTHKELADYKMMDFSFFIDNVHLILNFRISNSEWPERQEGARSVIFFNNSKIAYKVA